MNIVYVDGEDFFFLLWVIKFFFFYYLVFIYVICYFLYIDWLVCVFFYFFDLFGESFRWFCIVLKINGWLLFLVLGGLKWKGFKMVKL